MDTEVDRVIVSLEADLSNYNGKIANAATVTEQGMTRIGKSAVGAENAIGRMSLAANNNRIAMLELQHVGRGVADQIGSGTPVVQIFTQHLGELAEAAALSGSSMGKFGAFLGGPWGIALTIGTVLLAKFATMHTTAKASVEGLLEKMKEEADKTENSRLAHEAFIKTLQGQIAVMRALSDEMEKGFADNLTQDYETLNQAEKNLDNSKNAMLAAQKTLNEAIAKRDEVQNRPLPAGSDAQAVSGQTVELTVAQSSVYRAQEKVDTLKRSIADSSRAITDAEVKISTTTGQAMADQIKAINLFYDTKITQAQTAARSDAQALAGLTAQVAAYERLRKAALDAAKAGHESNKESGREVTSDQAAAIARAAGLQVNSASRTFGQQKTLYDNWVAAGRPSNNPVAAPGTSAHEGAKGRWALDIQLAPGVTPELLRKVFAAQGINLTKVFKEQGHFHVEGSRSQADAADEAQLRLAQAETARQKKVGDETANEDKSILEAKRALAGTIEEQADIDRKLLALAQQKFDADLKAQVKENRLDPTKGLTAAEAKVLQGLNDQAVELDRQLINRREEGAQSQQRLDVVTGLLQDQEDIAKSEQGLAITSKDRRDLALKILDIEYQAQKDRLTAQLLDQERNKVSQQLIDATKDQLATLEKTHANATTQTKRDNQSPLGDYLTGLQNTATGINDEFEKIAVGGLQNFTSGIADAIVHFRSLGDVARSVLQSILQQLIQMAIQMAILKIFGSAIGLAGGGSAGVSAFGSSAIDSFGTLPLPAIAKGGFIKLAGGGPGLVTGPGTSTSDSIPAWLSNGEYVIRAGAVQRIGVAALDHLNRNGKMPGFAGGGYASPRAFTPLNMMATPAGGAGKADLSDSAVAFLSHALGEAARIAPAVNLYASLDPADVLQKALGTRSGERAVIAMLGRNSGQVNGALRR